MTSTNRLTPMASHSARQSQGHAAHRQKALKIVRTRARGGSYCVGALGERLRFFESRPLRGGASPGYVRSCELPSLRWTTFTWLAAGASWLANRSSRERRLVWKGDSNRHAPAAQASLGTPGRVDMLRSQNTN